MGGLNLAGTRGDLPNQGAKVGNGLGFIGEHILAPCGHQDTQGRTVGQAQLGGKHMREGVTGKVPLKPQHITVGHGGGPHQLAAGIIAVGVSQRPGQLCNHSAHHRRTHLAAEGALLPLVEIPLKSVRKDIYRAGGGLSGR